MKSKTSKSRDLEITLPDFSLISDNDLIALRVQIEKQFKQRKIKFTVGDIGEAIAIQYFQKTPSLSNLLKTAVGTKNVDALSRDGERYSIKTIKEGGKTGTVYPDPIDRDKCLFEYMLVVQLDDDFELKSIHRFSWESFTEQRKWDRTMNAWYLPKTNNALNQGELLYEK